MHLLTLEEVGGRCCWNVVLAANVAARAQTSKSRRSVFGMESDGEEDDADEEDDEANAQVGEDDDEANAQAEVA